MQKTVFITGASSGIGKETAKFFVTNDWKVYGASRKCTSGEEKDGVIWVQLDLNNEESRVKAGEYLLSREKHLHALINNAGIGYISPMVETSLEAMKEVFESNVFGLLHFTQQLFPLLKNTSGSKIINTSSIAGSVGLPYRGVYSASKFALEGMLESMRMELKQFDIDVVILQPGDVKTGINEARQTSENVSPEIQEEFNRTIDIVTHEVNQGILPEQAAKTIFKIANIKRPKVRYQVGESLQKLTPVLKFLLPSRFFEKLIMNHYKIKKQP